VTVSVTNTGKRAGTEIVQLYIRDLVASVTRPGKLLKGFCRVALAPGETKKVSLTVPYGDLAIMSAKGKWVVEPGEFEALVGPSSREEDLLRVRFAALG
jgi:beta-glucosidase